MPEERFSDRVVCTAPFSGNRLRPSAGPARIPKEMGHVSDVLFLDDDEDLRVTFTDLVRTVFARECHGCGSQNDLIALGERALHCGVAILDINLGPQVPSGVDCYGWLRKHGFHRRIVHLTGRAAPHPLVAGARRLGKGEVAGKPVSLEALTSLLEDNLEAEHPPA